MLKPVHSLLAARFMTTIGHFLPLLIIFSTINNNVNASFSDSANSTTKNNAYNSSIAALFFGIFWFLFDFYGLFSGLTTFNVSVNMLQVIFHFIGTILLSLFITETWSYTVLWGIVILGNLPSFLVELIFLLKRHVFQSTVY